MLSYLLVACLLAIGATDGALNPAVIGNNRLGLDVYKVLAATPGNVLFCPVSAETILALTYLGAGGKTAAEMAQVLHLPNDHNAVVSGFKSFGESLKSSRKEVVFHSGNKIYAANDIAIKSDFNAKSVGAFRSETERLDFVQNTVAAKTINDWVEQQTNNKIKDLVDANSLDGLTRMVLVNAVYFLGKWKTEFTLKDEPMKFHLDATRTKDVPQMTIKDHFPFVEDRELGVSILEIPYKDDDFVLTILLPHKIDGLADIEARLHTIDLSKRLPRRMVSVTLPKFKIEQKIDLKAVLAKLGMQDAFADSANFTGISDEQLFISEIIQKTFIEVDEKGTEAAAATEVQIMLESAVFNPDPEVVVDRPIVFVLLKKSSGTQVFMGRLAVP